MKLKTLVVSAASVALLASTAVTAKPVGIVKGVMEVAGISRNQDNKATIHPAFAKTSRPCPPFCIQPTNPFAPAAVDTVSELDIIHAVRDMNKGANIMVIDARTPVWTTAKKGGTIKGAVNIPFNKLNSKAVAKDPDAVMDILTGKFGVTEQDGIFNFTKAKTLYLFCNGLWCGQSPAAIRALLSLGYPESKLKYYRSGMNAWHSLGLSTVGK
ncbi:rhodanese-like domain-containing protein [Bathymodiolus septemdierum thioautotrophic gill symbiont]|uniref:Rhodanese domain protein n=1 Tax=endosymbiont of Bathymodiolus septemdierum str. Myojin knoll TaxID=1303921 RepID=A0A0P0USD6_9GAMM|nr:rhodanese-like domain-containing protein [Bathymodiolus septemdierum thioautotrophic gill symbiont]BAS68002.1 rhodanese domain protein [endosymbiont of Bathymodiolus septemdierum str. Myojin knoll]